MAARALLRSRRVRRPHPLRNLSALLALHHADVILALQVEPELRAVAEIAAEPHRRVGGNRASRVENIGDAHRRPADVLVTLLMSSVNRLACISPSASASLTK